MDALIPALYLKGVSTGDFSEALSAILGRDAPGLSATNVVRLKAQWKDEYEAWQQRDLSDKHYVYLWADGVVMRSITYTTKAAPLSGHTYHNLFIGTPDYSQLAYHTSLYGKAEICHRHISCK